MSGPFAGGTMGRGIVGHDDRFDVLMLGDDSGVVAAGLMLGGCSPRGAMRSGSVNSGDGGVTISTLEQLETKGA